MVRRFWVRVMRAFFVVSFLLAPAQAAASLELPESLADTSIGPGDTACDPGATNLSCFEPELGEWFDWFQRAPMEEVAQWAKDRVLALGGTAARAPSAIPGYDILPDEAQRAAWRAWVLRAAYDAAYLPRFSDQPLPRDAPDDPVSSDVVAPALGPAKGLRTVWSADAQGEPIRVIGADDAGAFFLVTELGVLRFPGPSRDADWFLKPGGLVESAQATDANQDGTPDLVLGIDSFLPGDESPSIVVVDGTNGAVLWSGFAGDDRLWSWTLTDVDRDGRPDVLGLDVQDRIAAAALDGTPLFTAPLSTQTGMAQSAVVAAAALTYSPLRGHTFADVDGDGTQDVVVSRGFNGYAYASSAGALALFQFHEGQVAAHRGTDGSPVWETTRELGAAWTSAYVLGGGDVDGDGKDDALLRIVDDTYLLAIAVLAFVLAEHRTAGYAVVSGEDGTILVRDERRTVLGCAVIVCAPVPSVGEVDFEPLAIMDLDGDGVAEVVAMADEDASEDLAIVGRRPGSLEGGPSVEVYHRSVGFPHFDDWDGELLLRNADGDAKPDVVLYVLGMDRDEDGRVKSYESRVATITKGSVVNVPTSQILAAYDIVDSTGQAYGWAADDSRWIPVDKEGKATGTGPRLLARFSILARHDVTADGVDDLLLKSLSSVLWMDGATGVLGRELQRPLSRAAWGAEREGETLRLVERDWSTGSYFIVDLETGQTVWEIKEEMLKDGSVRAVRDFTGDGLLDVAVQYYDDEYDNFLDILERRAGTTILTLDYESRSAYFVDALPERVGEEILMVDYGDETDVIELYAVPDAEPRWKYDVGGYGHVVATDPGRFIVAASPDGETEYRVMSGTGTVLATLKAGDGQYLSGAAFVSTTDDDAVDVALVQAKADTDPREYAVTLFDGSTWSAGPTFAIAPAWKPDVDGMLGFAPGVAQGRILGDWDGDGRGDFVLQEQLVTTVRSGATGALLAVAPARGGSVTAFDVDGDGALELGVVSHAGRLSLFKFDASVEGLPPEIGPRLVVDEPALDILPDDDDGGGLPGFQLGLALVALGVLAWRRRTRNQN